MAPRPRPRRPGTLALLLLALAFLLVPSGAPAGDDGRMVVSGSGADGTEALAAARFAAVERIVAALLSPEDLQEHASAISEHVYSRVDGFVMVEGEPRIAEAGGRVVATVPVRVDVAAVREALVRAGVLVDGPGGSGVDAPPRPPELANVVLTVPDPRLAAPSLAHADVVEFRVGIEEDLVLLDATLARPVEDGMFVGALMYLDCDGRADTGIDGEDLGVRMGVGSRFRPNDFDPPLGAARPLDLRRASTIEILRVRPAGAVEEQPEWFNVAALPTPAAGGDRVQWSVPYATLKKAGHRYAETDIAFRLRVYTSCSEHPLAFTYDAIGDGREVVVDGRVEEWSGGPILEDAPDELHRDLRFLDIREVWCDHDAENLHVRVTFQSEGFSRSRENMDITVYDAVTVLVQPVGEDYMEPVAVRIPAGHVLGSVTGGTAASTGRHLEVAIPREKAQTHFRISVWSEARRDDIVGSVKTNSFRYRPPR